MAGRKVASCIFYTGLFSCLSPAPTSTFIALPGGTRVRFCGFLQDGSVGLVIEGYSHWVSSCTLRGQIVGVDVYRELRWCITSDVLGSLEIDTHVVIYVKDTLSVVVDCRSRRVGALVHFNRSWLTYIVVDRWYWVMVRADCIVNCYCWF